MKRRRRIAEPWAPAPIVVSVLLATSFLAVGLLSTIWLPELLQAITLLLAVMLVAAVRDEIQRRAGARRKVRTAPDLDEPDGFRRGILFALPGLVVTTAVTWAVGEAVYEIGAWLGIFMSVSFLVFDAIERRRWNRWYESRQSPEARHAL